MTWTALEQKSVHRTSSPSATAAFSTSRNARRLKINLVEAPEWWVLGQKMAVFVGSGNDAGSIRIEPKDKGAYQLIEKSPRMAGVRGLLLTFRVDELMPFASTQPRTRVEMDYGDEWVVVTMPSWFNVAASPAAQATRAVAPQANTLPQAPTAQMPASASRAATVVSKVEVVRPLATPFAKTIPLATRSAGKERDYAETPHVEDELSRMIANNPKPTGPFSREGAKRDFAKPGPFNRNGAPGYIRDLNS